MYIFILSTVIFSALIIFLSGPRVDSDTTLRPLPLPEDLDSYLQSSEAAFQDIVPGAEKTIIWAGEERVKTPLSVVYLHGFSACRQESAPLADIIAEELGANLFYTRFTGHGRSSEAMLDYTVNTCVNDIYEAIEIGRRIGEKVVVIGLSTGGTAATWLAAQPMAEYVSDFILISPNYALADKRSAFLTWPWAGHIAELVNGPEFSWEPRNDLHRKYWTCHFPIRALLPMMGFVNLTRSLQLESIKKPMLVLYSPKDQVVNPDAIEKIFHRIGSPRKQLIPITDTDAPQHHVLAGDILASGSTGKIAGMILDFIRN